MLTKHPADLTTRFLACYKITPAFLQANLQPSPALTGQIDDLPDAYLQKVIDLAAAIALRLDHPYIGTEHILLGIFEEESQISRICRSLNLNIPELKEQFLILLQKPEYQPFAYR